MPFQTWKALVDYTIPVMKSLETEFMIHKKKLKRYNYPKSDVS